MKLRNIVLDEEDSPNIVTNFINGVLSYIQGYYRKNMKIFHKDEYFEELHISLARLLSYLNNERDYVDIKEEIDFINTYISIQKKRFEDVDFQINIDNNLSGYVVEKKLLFRIIEIILMEHIEGVNSITKINISINSKSNKGEIMLYEGKEKGLEKVYHLKLL
ncbi:histidine kinase [Marispirochaeta sp.]|uniref:histidine kinase n=1 Tax=Marispirochaeta sp. TaxID=2038653 RepID=UPI0029C62241|nr:histidine kinase [Marispirochaeta sp.]